MATPSVERLNYLISNDESLISRGSLAFKQTDHSILITIIPSNDFMDIKSISFTYKGIGEDRLTKEFTVPLSIFGIGGGDLTSKLLSYTDKYLNPSSINAFDDTDTQEQKLINFFTFGLGNLLTISQLIYSRPDLFLPLTVQLPLKFNVNSLNKNFINSINLLLVNIRDNQLTNSIVKMLATNTLEFNRYFTNLFISGDLVYDHQPCNGCHDDVYIELNSECDRIVDQLKREGDIILKKVFRENENTVSKVEEYVNRAENVMNEIDESLAKIRDMEVKMKKMMNEFEIKMQIKLDEMISLSQEVHYAECNHIYTDQPQIQQIDDGILDDRIKTHIMGNEKMINQILDEHSDRMNKYMSRSNERFNRMEQLFDKLLKVIEKCK